MKILLTSLAIIMMIALIMMILVNLISKKTYTDREKSSPFECGFDPKSSPRLPFSLHFFLIAIIFLIFDVEIALIMPMIAIMNLTNIMSYTLSITFFLSILLIGLYHEWKMGALNWTN